MSTIHALHEPESSRVQTPAPTSFHSRASGDPSLMTSSSPIPGCLTPDPAEGNLPLPDQYGTVRREPQASDIAAKRCERGEMTAMPVGITMAMAPQHIQTCSRIA